MLSPVMLQPKGYPCISVSSKLYLIVGLDLRFYHYSIYISIFKCIFNHDKILFVSLNAFAIKLTMLIMFLQAMCQALWLL